jgi:hypothetical protein
MFVEIAVFLWHKVYIFYIVLHSNMSRNRNLFTPLRFLRNSTYSVIDTELHEIQTNLLSRQYKVTYRLTHTDMSTQGFLYEF